jgi:hypothetical protein
MADNSMAFFELFDREMMVRVAGAQVIGKKSVQEDLVHVNVKHKRDNRIVLGVFDGHGASGM